MAKKKRKYTKRNKTYWENRSSNTPSISQQLNESNNNSFDAFTLGNSYAEMAEASGRLTRGGSSKTTTRKNAAAFSFDERRFQALRASGSPFIESGDGIVISDAIHLCRVAYFNIAVFANSIDIMSEFSNTEHYVSGGSVKGRKFFDAWLKKINIEDLKQQFFREYFRGGNIFLYRVEGDLDVNGVKTLAKMSDSSSKATKIPVKYVLLDACSVTADNALMFDGSSYFQVLSEYQVKKLKNPTTEQDRLIFESLPAETQKDIKNGNFTTDGVFMKINPKQVLMAFYKKQDYEAFAVPFGYRVLDDINAKIELKKTDAAIVRAVENVILLITMGESAKDGGAGVNQKNVDAVRSLFENESAGRVLVSDYTTKADFIIPDLKKVVGKEKYEVLNEDIKEGLQNIIVGKENYGNTQMKADMFLERLREARQAFINFIQPEFKRLAKEIGLKKTPDYKFKELDLSDENTLLRVVTRMVELAILTPQQAMDTIDTGKFPDPEELRAGHEKFVEDRKEGLYNPVVGGVPMWINPEDEKSQVRLAKLNSKLAQENAPKENAPKESATAQVKAGQKKPTGQKAKGRPIASTKKAQSAVASIDDFTNTVDSVLKLEKHIVKEAKDSFGVKRLNKDQKEACKSLCVGIVESAEQKDWIAKASKCQKDRKEILKLSQLEGITEKMEEHEGLPSYPAALLYHSIKNK